MDLVPPNLATLEDVKVYLERQYEYLKWIGNFQCQFMEWQEVDDPEAPNDGRARIYAIDYGSGRTALVGKFPTGTTHLIVVEGQTTDDQSEGSTNLFFTNERVDDRVNDLIVDGDGIQTTYDDAAGTLTFAVKQQTHEVDATSAHSITDPGDSPSDADDLRDDLVTNTIPSIESALNALGAKINAILLKLETAEIFSDS